MSYESYHTTLSAINKVQPNPAPLSRGEDVLVSWDNPDEDDEKPKIIAIANSDGVIVVTYEKKVDMLSRVIPISYSEDDGASWIIQFEVDSVENEGSGYLNSPDVTYSSVAD